MLKAYLEDFKLIKLIINKQVSFNEDGILAISNLEQIPLKIINKKEIGKEYHIYLESMIEFKPYIDYQIFVNNNTSTHLSLGRITQTDKFDKDFYFDGWLGFKYNKENTIFRVWSPVIKEISLILNDQKVPMQYTEKGVWEIVVNGDIERYRYHYEFRIDDEIICSLDPYAVSSNANHQENYVVDLDKTYQMQYSYYDVENFKNVDAIIYELNVRDATSVENVKNPGTYKALINSKNKNFGLGHIKKLGITHIQLMPVYAFGGVNELIQNAKDKEFLYNWGYNPMQYNVPSGYFSLNPNDPYARINELKELIDTIHSLNLGINMDVVYNHVYDSSFFPFAKMVPGYTFRTDQKGFLTNASWCGNDVNTNHLMIKKFIHDSLKYYQTFYHIDGFRFDLMGLIDMKTINQASLMLKEVNPNTMLYGEGWNMGANIPNNGGSHMGNNAKMLSIAFFNDGFRDTIRGKNNYLGYVMGSHINKVQVMNLLKGYFFDYGKFKNLNQSVQYFECHDNYTLVDLIKIKIPGIRIDQIVDYVRLAFGLLILSQGIPFIHAGSEFLRTKQLIDNSYNLPDNINGINWHNPYNVVESVTDLIKIRKKYDHFKNVQICDIDRNFRIDSSQELVSIRIKNNKSEELQLIISNNYEKITKYFSPGTVLLYDSIRICNQQIDKLVIERPGIYLLKK